MKKILIILGLLVLLALGVTTYVLLTKKTENLDIGVQGTLPLSQTGTQTIADQEVKMNLKMTNGSQVAVRNFLASAGTRKDPENAGYYTLGDQQSQSTTYLITYIDETNYFNIVLVKEPLGHARTQAETYLTNTLGISKEEMCLLDYTISVPNAVNSNFSGVNLGFSFCPSAVKLP